MNPTSNGNDGGAPTFVCVSGSDASGKSTQVEALTRALAERGETVAPVTIWDALDVPHVARKLPFRDRAEVFAYLGILGTGSRAHFLFHALHVALEVAVAQAPDIVLLNAHWYKYFATEVAHGGDPDTVRAWTAGFPEPDTTFYLRISPETALARKRERSDYESGYGDAEAFLAFQRRSLTVLDRLCTEYGWTELDATAAPDTLTETMLATIGSGGRR